MHKSSIIVFNEHLFIVQQGVHILVNTGSPYSFGRSVIEWRGQQLDLCEGLELIDLDELSEGMGVRVDGVLGAEHLLEGPIFISMIEEQLTVGVEQGVATVPIVQILIDGVLRNVMVDTAAKQSFVAPHLAKESTRAGMVQDYHMSSGSFEAELISAHTITDHGTIPLKIAVAPACLKPLFDQYEIDFVVGLDHLLAEPSLLTSNSINPMLSVELL